MSNFVNHADALPDYVDGDGRRAPRWSLRRRWRRHWRTRRARFTAILLTVALLALSLGVWASPEVRRWGKGPTPEQVALQRSEARAEDLKRQVEKLTAELEEPDPPDTDAAAMARAADLKRQVEELEDKLGIPRPPVTDGAQRARADDLNQRLKAAEERLRVPRPATTDGVQAARAADLAAQNESLEQQLRRPRPTVDPLTTVTASLTKADILAARNVLGLYTVQAPFNYGEVDLIQSTVQRKANVIGYFQSFNDPFNPFPIRNSWLRQQIPLLTWESQNQVGSITADAPEFSLPRIIDGAYDDYIRSYAQGIAQLRMPLILRFDHEMNGTWYPWSEWADAKGTAINGNHQGDYIRAWRHVHDIFSAEGANDYVIWLWSPNRINRVCGQRKPWAFYPGDDYTDWVGMSGYFRDYENTAGPCDDISPTFEGVFGATLPELRADHLAAAPDGGAAKPIFLAEIGATEDGGDKVDWIAQLFAGLRNNPDIIGFAWFSLSVSSGGEDRNTHDWRVNSTGGAEAAMRDGLAASGVGIQLAP